MSAALFDTSALLAVIRKEKGAAMVEKQLRHPSLISSVNYTELLYVMRKYNKQDDWEEIIAFIDDFDLEIIPYTEHQAKIAANIHSVSRKYGISLGDCACLACAMDYGVPVLTADAIWEKIPFKRNIDIRVIR